MRTWIFPAFLLAASLAFGQQPSSKLAFEVASIKPSEPPTMGRMMIRMGVDAEMLRYNGVPLKQIIRTAYRVYDFQVEGPDWLESTRFDITAKLPEGATEEQVPEMLQALLEERFKLKLHRDTKEHNIYALVPGKDGAKLTPAETTTAEGPGPSRGPGGSGMPRGGMRLMMGAEGARLGSPSLSLSQLADMLSRFTERPVVDRTGIEGQYAFQLTFTPETMRNLPGGGMRGPGAMPPPGGGPGPAEMPAERAGSIYDALAQYGLKLDARKAPMDLLVIDHIEKEPTDN